MAGSYDHRLVALSVVIAICASYAALDLAGRATAARGRIRAAWLIAGATAMGLGIWSMHYIGMLAFSLPVPVQYDWPTVLLSLIAAILASAVALYVVSRHSAQTLELKSAEHRYRLLFERSLAGVIRTTPDGKILDCNDACARIFGYASREELIASPITNRCVHPEDQEVFLTKLKREKSLTNYEHCLRRKDGSPVWLLGSAHLVDGKDGAPAVNEETLIDITTRKKAEEIFRTAFNANPEPITIATISEGRYIDVNESFLRVTGYQREEVIGRTSLELKFWERPEDRNRLVEILWEQGSVRDLEITYRTKSGEERIALDSAEAIEIAGEECIIAILRDITEQKSLEKQLRQTQKMEAIGQLTGGIAHDFNNLLGVIIGYSEILEQRLPPADPLRRECGQIKKAGQSAASLTRQLLAFSRQQVLEPRVLDLNAIVLNVEKMLRRLIGEHIDLRTTLDPALGSIKADQSQIEQVIMNLAVNARDAMPQGGKLMIETANVNLDEDYARLHPPQLPGAYVLLSVADTGMGMDRETQNHIFEPFFTTKEVGKGTGLGLSTVYGVVRQSGGHIWVYSEPGQGTTFKIYLPQAGKAARGEKSGTRLTDPLRGAQTILLVEDEDALRELTRNILENSGYTILEAERPDKAIEIALRHSGPIHLLLTDMVMPGMNGRALALNLAPIRPEMKVVYMSGYTGFTNPELSDSEINLLPKPYTRDALLRKLQEALESEVKLEAK
jgi:two-component system cell cycle sensor histidine kinase/response regulator CckA